MKQLYINSLLLLSFCINGISAEEQRAPRPPFPIPSQEAQDQEQLFPQHESNIFEGTITVEGNIIIQNNNNDANMYCLIFQKSRLGGKVQNNDEIGCIEFEGHDGFQNGAAIRSHVDGTPATGIVPGRIEFYTEPTTQGTAFERMRITGTGFIGIGTQAPFAELQLDNTSFGFSLQERGITPAGVGPFINLGSFVSGKYAYLIGTGSRLAIFDISNPNNPVALGSVATAGSPLQVFVLNNLAYVGTSSGNFQIFDVSNPNISPVLLSTTNVIGATWLFVRGTLAYIIRNAILSIYDVSNPHLPVLKGSTIITAIANRVFVENNYAYIINTATPSDLQIYDITNPALITLKSNTTIPTTTQPNALFVKGNTAYIVTEDGLFFIYDVTNPTSPTLLSTTTLTDHGRQINVYDNYAYVSMPTDGVSVFDVSSPATPVNVYNNMNFFPLMVSGNFVYARDTSDSNFIIANGPISLYAHKNASLLGNVEVNSIFNVARGLLYADGTTNQVGINTPFPGAALDVNGDARISQDLLVTNSANIFGPVAINTDPTLTSLYANQNVAISNNVESTSLNVSNGTLFVSGGQVGINLLAPLATLQVVGNMAIANNLFVAGNATIGNNLTVNQQVSVGNEIRFNTLHGFPLFAVGSSQGGPVRFCYGAIAFDGTVTGGSGDFTCGAAGHVGIGDYVITFNPSFSTSPMVAFVAVGGGPVLICNTIQVVNLTASLVEINIITPTATFCECGEAGCACTFPIFDFTDFGFHFIAIGLTI